MPPKGSSKGFFRPCGIEKQRGTALAAPRDLSKNNPVNPV
jgi:hypothetical protein